AGIQQGDIITTVNGQPITSLNAFTQLLTQANGPFALQVTRAGQTRDLQLAALGSEDASVRTALRPNFDTGVTGNANINAQGAASRGWCSCDGDRRSERDGWRWWHRCRGWRGCRRRYWHRCGHFRHGWSRHAQII